MVETIKPYCLPKVGSLAGRLVEEPLLFMESLRERGRAEFVIFVICFNEVFDDGTGLPEYDAGVWVLDGGDTRISVRRQESIRGRLIQCPYRPFGLIFS